MRRAAHGAFGRHFLVALNEHVTPRTVHVPVMLAPLTVALHVPGMPVAVVPAYEASLPDVVPVYDAAPRHLKFVSQPVCVMVHVSLPQPPEMDQVAAMFAQAPVELGVGPPLGSPLGSPFEPEPEPGPVVVDEEQAAVMRAREAKSAEKNLVMQGPSASIHGKRRAGSAVLCALGLRAVREPSASASSRPPGIRGSVGVTRDARG